MLLALHLFLLGFYVHELTQEPEPKEPEQFQTETVK